MKDVNIKIDDNNALVVHLDFSFFKSKCSNFLAGR